MKASTSADALVLTPDQVAELLCVKRRQLDRMGVPCLRLGRKTLRYLRQDVLRWIDEQRAGAV